MRGLIKMDSGTQPLSSGFSIPFALSCNQQSLRLFELPDELVDLVATTLCPRLHLKSATDSSTSNGIQFTPNTKSSEYVHLCSEELGKSWSVRQVSTSNEVYVVQAVRAGQEVGTNEDTDIADLGQSNVVLTAIARTDSMLELLPATVDVEAHLRQLLPVYGQDQLVKFFGRSGELNCLDHEEDEHMRLICQIPAPDTSIRETWRRLCVSLFYRPSVVPQKEYFIPTVQLLESAWNSALAAYNIRSSGKGAMERADFEDSDDGADDLLPVKVAIWQRLCSADGSSLERAQTVAWVIRNLWQSRWESSATEHRKIQKRVELEELWRNRLPREFEEDASVDKLEDGTYELYMEGGEELIRWTGRSKVIPASQSMTAKLGKRKWHEKFRDSKNMKR